jgi:hypothetical protein
MDVSFNIVEMIEHNNATNLSSAYKSKLLTKIKDNFTDTQQQMFVASFYCYLNYDSQNDYVIDLDNIWKWLGFSTKQKAKDLLEKQFTINNDYKKTLSTLVKQSPHTKGGQNKELFLLNIITFKKFCLKTGTKKADEIHDFFIKLEKFMHDIIKEESDELRLQLDKKNIEFQTNIEKIEKEKDAIREKTLLEQFTKNVQCVYYGSIDNISCNNEKLIKFGNSNNLKNRIKCHKDTYENFTLINAFKVENKLQIENAIKENGQLNERLRTITIKNKKFVELLNMEGLSFIELDKIIKEIITSVEYSPENYIKILEENKLLKKTLAETQENKHANEVAMLKIENARLQNENVLIIKKYNSLKKRSKDTFDDSQDAVEETNVPLFQTYEDVVNTFKTKEVIHVIRNANGTCSINGKIYKSLIGSREDVWNEVSYKTSGGLIKTDFILNAHDKIVSKKKSIEEFRNNRLEKVNEAKKQQKILSSIQKETTN